MRNATLTLFLLLLFCACLTETWYRTESGLLYRVFPAAGKDSIARIGRTIKVHYIQKAGDTVIESTYAAMPYYELIMPIWGNPYNPSAVFPGLKKGDSVVVKQRVDSMLRKKIFTRLPPYLRKDDEWITTIRVLDVFLSDSAAQADKQRETEIYLRRLRAQAGARLTRYFRDRQILAKATGEGSYLQVVRAIPASSDTAAQQVQFRLETLEGRKVNDSRDTGQFKGPLIWRPGLGMFPPAIEAELKGKTTGTELFYFTPAVNLYGLQPQPPLRRDDVLVLRVWVQ